MSDLKFEVDIESLSRELNNFKEDVMKDVQEGVSGLSRMTFEKTKELANDELGSLSELYIEQLEWNEVDPTLWVVTLKEPALWIEEGRKSGFMEELLRGKSAKQGKNGKYAVIPFEHNKNPSKQSSKSRELAGQIRDELKKENVNWKKIETDESGSPRVGRLHTFNFDIPRLKEKHKTSPGQGVAVYQIKDETGKVQKHIMTFRVISEKHREEGLWNHPGRPGDKLLDKAFDWAMDTWEKEILPKIYEKHK